MSYPGSKGQAGVFQRIIGQMPPHSVYVEPFFGSGRIFHEKKPAAASVIIDINAGVLARYGVAGSETVQAIHGDAIAHLPELTLPADALVYCDPPYLLETRQNRRYYANEFETHHHTALLTLLQALKCRVMISGYPSELYGAALQSWRCLAYRTRTRGRTVTECLWCNFPEPVELHDWRYAGQSHRERVTLKRLAARWLRKLEAMPPRKRGYVLNAIDEGRGWRGDPLWRGGTATPELAGGADAERQI